MILGSPSYMAPEQALGSRDIGPPADVYATGAILYQLLTGRPPFKAPTVLETIEQVKFVDAVPPSRLVPRLPRDLETICLVCLRKEPHRRYPTALALAEDIRRSCRAWSRSWPGGVARSDAAGSGAAAIRWSPR